MLQENVAVIVREAKRMSYSLVAARHGMTRGQIAGIIWRAKNPPHTLIKEPTKTSGGYNRCGRGHCGPGAYPPLTMRNT